MNFLSIKLVAPERVLAGDGNICGWLENEQCRSLTLFVVFESRFVLKVF